MRGKRTLGWIVVVAVAFVGIAGFVGSGSAQVRKGKKRPLETRHLMSGLVKAHCNALKKALDAGPGGEDAWDAVVLHAALLNESSYILMADGRCPDATWAKSAGKTLREASQGVLDAAAKKDVEAARGAFGALVKSCGACHRAHKKKKKSGN